MMKIPEEGLYRIDNQESKLRIEKIDNADGVVSRDKNIATLDAENISFPLILRNVTAGDRFHPFGMRGSRLLSDYMTDRKMNIYEKRRQLVLTDANDNILWVVGERTDNRYKVTDNTQHVLRVTLL
jgi:tRNA(Ile)-lysidine synthase